MLFSCYNCSQESFLSGRMGNTDAATVAAKTQLVKPDQRLELRVTLTLMETLSPEWSITGQDPSIWSKMPLGEQHLQQLSFSLMLTLGSCKAARPVLLCSLHSPDSCKVLTCNFGSSQALFCSPPLPIISLILVLNLSSASYPLASIDPQEKSGVNYIPSVRAERCSVDRLPAQCEGITDTPLLLLSVPSPLNI